MIRPFYEDQLFLFNDQCILVKNSICSPPKFLLMQLLIKKSVSVFHFSPTAFQNFLSIVVLSPSVSTFYNAIKELMFFFFVSIISTEQNLLQWRFFIFNSIHNIHWMIIWCKYQNTFFLILLSCFVWFHFSHAPHLVVLKALIFMPKSLTVWLLTILWSNVELIFQEFSTILSLILNSPNKIVQLSFLFIFTLTAKNKNIKRWKQNL